MSAPAEPGRSVAGKITTILSAFTEGREHSLTELSRAAGLPLSTAHRLAGELAAWRLLERAEDGTFRIGLLLRTLGAGPRPAPGITERAPCVLDDLTAATGCRSRFGVLRGLEVAYIEKRPGFTPVTSFAPAARLPVAASALGRALLAFSPSTLVEEIIRHDLRLAHRPTFSPAGLRRTLSVTRLTKVAVNHAERPGMCSVAMPVFGAGGAALAAIDLTVRDRQADVQAVRAVLAVATRSLSRELVDDAGDEDATADVS